MNFKYLCQRLSQVPYIINTTPAGEVSNKIPPHSSLGLGTREDFGRVFNSEMFYIKLLLERFLQQAGYVCQIFFNVKLFCYFPVAFCFQYSLCLTS